MSHRPAMLSPRRMFQHLTVVQLVSNAESRKPTQCPPMALTYSNQNGNSLPSLHAHSKPKPLTVLSCRKPNIQTSKTILVERRTMTKLANLSYSMTPPPDTSTYTYLVSGVNVGVSLQQHLHHLGGLRVPGC